MKSRDAINAVKTKIKFLTDSETINFKLNEPFISSTLGYIKYLAAIKINVIIMNGRVVVNDCLNVCLYTNSSAVKMQITNDMAVSFENKDKK